MVIGFDEGFLTPLGQIFPVTGAWSSLVGVLVGVRVLLYALAAQPNHENPLREIGSWILYFFVLFYFGPYVLVVVLALHFAKKMGYIKLGFLNSILPSAEGSSRDVNIFIFAAMFSWLYSSGTIKGIDAFVPLPFLQNVFGWIAVLLVMLFFVRPKEDSTMRQALIGTFVVLGVVLLALGPTALHILLIFLLVKPFISKFKVTEKISQAPAMIRQRAQQKAVGPGFKEQVANVAMTAAMARYGGGKGGAAAAAGGAAAGGKGLTVADKAAKLKQVRGQAQQEPQLAQLLQKYSHNIEEKESKEIDSLRQSIDKRLEGVGGLVQNLNARQQVDHGVEVDELKDKYSDLKSEVPSTWKFVLAFVVALISDIVDLLGIGAIPGVSTVIDVLTLLFVLPVVMPAISSVKAGKGMGNIIGLILPAGEFIGEGPFVFLDLFPFWTLGVGALWLFSHFGSTAKEMKKTKKELKKLKSASGGKQGFEMPSYVWKLAAAFIVIIILLLFVVPQTGIFPSVANAAENTVRYIGSGELTIDSQLATKKAVDFMVNFVKLPEKWWSKQIAIASGDFYTGEVDASSNRKLGVFLEDIRSSQKTFTKGEPTTVWVNLKGETLDIQYCYEHPDDAKCVVKLYCRAEGAATTTVFPKQVSFLDLVSSGQLISCDFTSDSSGSKTVRIIAAFDFETRSYIPVYFVDRTLKIDYAKQGKDILTEQGITEKTPVARYTPGPVGIGIETFEAMPLAVLITAPKPTGSMFTGYAVGEPQGTGFGITLENLWTQGSIRNVKDMQIIVPESLKIERCAPANFTEFAKKEGETYYRMDPEYAKESLDVKDFVSFNCRITSSGSPSAVLGATPVTTHFIKVNATYSYGLEAKTDVKVLEKAATQETFE